MRPWSQHVANLARAAFWLLLALVLLLQLVGSRGIDRQRSAALGQFERERSSRVIAMIHRQEGASLASSPRSGTYRCAGFRRRAARRRSRHQTPVPNEAARRARTAARPHCAGLKLISPYCARVFARVSSASVITPTATMSEGS
ncbi:MAG TPA: hypothetical protein VNJ06_05620, partial [Gemmatimonadales bacterium]|nr:hypothetical protein [Gemmatimonadales bacterium]